ncbi:gliding motility-associated C-terminal domain-containing protein [Hymenobacter arizonensis]|uniref:Gliding motility-associated C-terminal domain-containing protein n=1 Tax=Hymenobacter arizonensis TaxID=1227077 RepID=A0A1I5ZAI4_HYMAR|nr:gliding motility-associated C-terminal domain-containing protein [Hymenobacter arizonensis]SFQ53137.1 gliding motility-associated C-terminal domain-containing protein [Hymenobacter arizonensis]
MPAELSHPAPSSTNVFYLPPTAEPSQLAGANSRCPASRVRPATSWLLTLLLLLLSGAATSALAQGTPPPECAADEKFANTWYFGFKAGLDFNKLSTDSLRRVTLPEVLTNGAMDAPAGSGVMSDENGEILFYSNGENVWNGDGTVMANGTGLAGNRFTTDGPLPLKRPGLVLPGQPRRYLLFTLDSTAGLSYSEIEFPAGSRQGTVIAATKNTPLARGTAEKITGVFHRNGCDIWVIIHGWGDAKTGNDNRGDAFLAYRVRTTGVDSTPIISEVGSLHAPSVAALGYKGQMKVTPDGQRLALARYSEAVGDSSSTVELFGFNTGTGAVTVNPQVPFIVDSGQGKYYGVSFSPGSYLYATVNNPPKLLQFNLRGPGPVTKEEIPLKTTVNLGSMQAAPDGKIYVARDNQPALGFIAFPDSLGAKVGYADDSLQLGGSRLSGLGLVNFNQSSLLRVGPSFEITGCRQITFTAPPINFAGKIYTWTFGDGVKTTPSSTDSVITHTYDRPGNYTVTLRIETECFCRESSGGILVPDLPNPGAIAGPQTLCAGTPPPTLTSTTAATGDTRLPLVYEWESSFNNSPYAGTGVTSASYTPPTSLPVGTTSFRRRAQLLLPAPSGLPYCTPTFTDPVTIRVLPALTAGTIAASQTICVGTVAAPLTSATPATGGDGVASFVYQWEFSSDDRTWSDSPGATSEIFPPGVLTATTYFRRRVTSGPCGPEFSQSVKITVLQTLNPGTIAADPNAICEGSTPAQLTSTSDASGPGIINYRWEFQPAGSTTWSPTGTTGSTYPPGPLSTSTSFRRQASSDSACAPVFSNIVTINVVPALTAGTIGTDQLSLCSGATPARLTSITGASGGTGNYEYLWEVSGNNANWTTAPGPDATSADYPPGPVTSDTYYRRRVISGPCGPVYSASVLLRVLPPLNAGSIAANQTICAGAVPSPLTSTAGPSGGTGTFDNLWESSLDSLSWTSTGTPGLTFVPGSLTATTYYRRRVTSGTGTCSIAFSNVVTIRVQPVVTIGVTLTPPPVQCPGIPLTFTAVPTANAGPTPSFQWFVNNVAVFSGSSFTSSTLVTGDVVRVEVTPTAGLCSTGPTVATVTVTRTPTPLPTLAIAVQPGGAVCLGSPLTFSIASVTEAGPAPEYQWQVNGNDVAGATGPVFTSTTLREGQIVTLRLRTTNACAQQVTVVSNGITVRILPPVDVDAGPDKEILAGTSVLLEGRADGNYPVTWTPSIGLTFPGNDPLRPVAAPLETTTYTLSAGEGGCADSDQVTVTVRPPIRIPNAFTPNGDGRDDTWQIEFIEQFPENTVSVFNRWGNRIFSAENYSRANEWRGDINGQPAPVGTYYYVVVTKGPLGKSYSGSITILY